MEDRPETLGTVIGMLKEGLHFGVNFISKHFENTDNTVQTCMDERKDEHEAILKAIAQTNEHIQHLEMKMDILLEWEQKTYGLAFNGAVISAEMKQHLCPELYDREEKQDA